MRSSCSSFSSPRGLDSLSTMTHSEAKLSWYISILSGSRDILSPRKLAYGKRPRRTTQNITAILINKKSVVFHRERNRLRDINLSIAIFQKNTPSNMKVYFSKYRKLFFLFWSCFFSRRFLFFCFFLLYFFCCYFFIRYFLGFFVFFCLFDNSDFTIYLRECFWICFS